MPLDVCQLIQDDGGSDHVILIVMLVTIVNIYIVTIFVVAIIFSVDLNNFFVVDEQTKVLRFIPICIRHATLYKRMVI